MINPDIQPHIQETDRVVRLRIEAYFSGVYDETGEQIIQSAWSKFCHLAGATALDSGISTEYISKPAEPKTTPLDDYERSQLNYFLMQQSQLEAKQNGFNLTGREREVLDLVRLGLSNAEIGSKLYLSTMTVKSHLSRIGKKLEAGSRAEMVYLYYQN